MSIKINHNGIEYSASTPEEAVALGRLLSDQPILTIYPNAPILDDRGELALIFLRAIRDSAPDGLHELNAQKVLGVDTGRAVGGKIYAIRNALENIKFKPDAVFEKVDEGGEGHWMPGPKFRAALETLEEISNY